MSGTSTCQSIRSALSTYVASPLSSAASKTSKYVSENRYSLLAYAIGWGMLFACLGYLYGFRTTALPLLIGAGCGAAVGILLGIIIYKAKGADWVDNRKKSADPDVNPDMPPSVWGVVSEGVYKLDAHGTRWLLLTVVFAVVLTFTKVFPLPMGALGGFLAANQLTVKIAYQMKTKTEKELQQETLHRAFVQFTTEQ